MLIAPIYVKAYFVQLTYKHLQKSDTPKRESSALYNLAVQRGKVRPVLISGNVIDVNSSSRSRGGCEINTVPVYRFQNMMKSKSLCQQKAKNNQKKDRIKAEIREDEKHIGTDKKIEKTKA